MNADGLATTSSFSIQLDILLREQKVNYFSFYEVEIGKNLILTGKDSAHMDKHGRGINPSKTQSFCPLLVPGDGQSGN